MVAVFGAVVLEVEVHQVGDELQTELSGLRAEAARGPVDGEQEVTQRGQQGVGLLTVLERGDLEVTSYLFYRLPQTEIMHRR